MAAINSITYLLYSILTLTANNKPTDPPLNALEIGSESQVTEEWNQEPHYVTRKYNEESCPAGETFSECDAGCQTTCENVGKPVICPRMCVPGCVCEEPGAVRGPDKKCIHPPLCPSADVDPDETSWTEQDPPFPTFNPDETSWTEQDPIFPTVDPDETSWAEQDLKISRGKCGAKEKYLVCGSACPDNCTNLGKPRPCTTQCVPGCFCLKGLFRNDEGKCVPLKECPKTKCGANEEYRECGTACPANCTNLGKPRPCTLKCVRGCFCSKGHVRSDQGKCVPLKECPKNKCGANEEYLRCGCKATCANLGKTLPCTTECVQGCFCSKELVRDARGKCVPPEECPKIDPDETSWAEQDPNIPTDNGKRCPAGEKWSTCGFLCQRTCENVGKLIPCPLVCQSGCVCETLGNVRGPDKKCIHPSLCPSAYVDPDETSWAEQDLNIPRVDPDETDWAEQDPNIPTVDPDETDWAEQDPNIPRVDPDEPDWAEQDHNIPRVDPDESVWTEQDPNISAGKFNSGGCPDTSACLGFCKRRKYRSGICIGSDKKICQCYTF